MPLSNTPSFDGVATPHPRRPLLRGTLGTSVALAAGQVTTGIAILLMARRLPVNEFGTFAALYAASTGLATLLDFGSSQKWTRELARTRDMASYHHWLGRRTAAQLPIVLLFATLASALLRHNALSTTVVIVLSAQALTATMSYGSLAAVRVLVSPARAAWLVFAGNTVFLICALVAPTSSLLMIGAVGASSSWLLTTALALFTIRGLSGVHRTRSERNPWAGTAGFGLFGLAVALQPFDVVIVGALAGASEAGRIAAVSRWVQPILLLTYAYGNNAFPSLAAAKSDRDAFSLLRSFIPVLLAVLGLCVMIVVMAPWLVSSLLGPGYGSSVLVLRLLALWCLPVAVNQPCVAFLQARGQEHFLAVITLGITTANLLAIAALAHALGATAIPIVALIGFSSLSVVLLHRLRRAGMTVVTV